MKYTLIEKILVQGVGFLQGIVLARLLCPEDFGLAAMLGIFLGVGSMLAESGLGTALVVCGGVGMVAKVFRWNVGMAIGAYVLLAIAAPWIAEFYQQPILRELTWVMGLGLIINAASVSWTACLQRGKKFRELSTVNTAAVLLSSVVGVGMAAWGCGVWSIAGLGIAYALVRLLVLWMFRRSTSSGIAGSSNEGDFSKLISYGWKNTLSALVHTVYANGYQLIIGKMLTPAAVGLFNRGQRWAMLPVEIVNESIGRVALPELVVVGSRSRRWFWVNIALLWPGLVILWIWAEEIVGLVLGAQWLECVPYLRIIILGAAFTPISNVMLCKIRASGRMNLLLLTDAIKKPLQIIGLVVGAFFGIKGLCWAVVAGEAIEAVVDGVVGGGSWRR